MPSFLMTTLFVLSFLGPVLMMVIGWARKPQTIEGLVVAMTVLPLIAVAVHVAFAIWLLPQYQLSIADEVVLMVAWVVTIIGTGIAAYYLSRHASRRIRYAAR